MGNETLPGCPRRYMRVATAAGVVALAFGLGSAALRADVVRLKVGTTVRGEIVKETETEVTIREKGGSGTLTFRKADVAKVVRETAPAGGGGGERALPTASSGAGVASKGRAAFEDTRWLDTEDAAISEEERRESARLESEYGARIEALRAAGDGDGLRALAGGIEASAARFPGEEGDRLDQFAGRALEASGDVMAKAAAGRKVTADEALTIARRYAAGIRDRWAAAVSGLDRPARDWYRKAAVLSPDPYAYDGELRDREFWQTLPEIRDVQAKFRLAAEPRQIAVGKPLPPYRHQRGTEITTDDFSPDPYPQEQRAWERFLVKQGESAIIAGDRLIFLPPGQGKPALYDWYELHWDVATGAWAKTSTLDQFREREVKMVRELAELMPAINDARGDLNRAREECRRCRRDRALAETRLAEKMNDKGVEFWQGRLQEAATRRTAAQEKGRKALERHRTLMDGLAKRAAGWEETRTSVLRLMGEERKALKRNYLTYTPPAEVPER